MNHKTLPMVQHLKLSYQLFNNQHKKIFYLSVHIGNIWELGRKLEMAAKHIQMALLAGE